VGTRFSKWDTVATGEQSWAKIGFDAGGDLEMDPGTLVVLADHPTSLQLKFLSGTGKVRIGKKAKKKIVVTRKSETPGLREGISQTERVVPPGKKDGPVEVIMVDEMESLSSETSSSASQEGNKKRLAALHSFQEKSIRLPLRRSTALDPNSLASLPPSPEALYPMDGEVLDLDPARMPFFRWKTQRQRGKKMAAYEVIVRSADLTGKPTVLSTRKSRIRLTKQSIRQPGRYMWAVRSVTRNGRKSPISSFHWFEVNSIKLAEIKPVSSKPKRVTPKRKPASKKRQRKKRRLPLIKEKPEVYPVIIE
jgi:hypothetical protein